MNDQPITVWGSTLLQSGALPPNQFNATAGMRSRSIQVTNASLFGIVFRANPGLDIFISAGYQLTAPLLANTQYSISAAPGQVGTSQDGQSVTVAESEQEASYQLTPIIQIAGRFTPATVWGQTVGAALGFSAFLAQWAPSAAKPFFTRASVSAIVRGTSPGAAEAMVQMTVFDPKNSWMLLMTVANEGGESQDDANFVNPARSELLDPTQQWTLAVQIPNIGLPGTAVTDLVYYAEWTF